ncbi:MAG: glycosyltransferase family 4 protein, partial [Bacteroidota bacterium]|nr:glycosyltransferase family 4 protein [Bacteroidota bacterium]
HTPSRSQMTLCFIGSLDWVPNIEGLEWFLSNCWPLINKNWPGITLHIAGRNTPKNLSELRLPNVIIHGEVDDATAFISSHSVMIVPLFSGSGMRVKIVEGMFLGKAVISTSLGKEGIEGDHMTDLLIANDVDEFIKAIGFCITHPKEVINIGVRAKEKAILQFNSKAAGQQILQIYQALLTYKKEEARHSTPDSISA